MALRAMIMLLLTLFQPLVAYVVSCHVIPLHHGVRGDAQYSTRSAPRLLVCAKYAVSIEGCPPLLTLCIGKSQTTSSCTKFCPVLSQAILWEGR
jgi:hypothetical protein